MRHSLSCVGGLLFLVVVAGCSSISDQRQASGWSRAIGFIDSGGVAVSPIMVPDTVQAGAPFAVTVSTFGSSGCIRPDQSHEQQTAWSADITPYDSVWVGSEICPADWRAHPRSVELTFDRPGAALILLHGRSFDHDLTLQRTVTIRP